jgi:hypothetical protein
MVSCRTSIFQADSALAERLFCTPDFPARSEQAAIVHFLQPIHPLRNCMGTIPEAPLQRGRGLLAPFADYLRETLAAAVKTLLIRNK